MLFSFSLPIISYSSFFALDTEDGALCIKKVRSKSLRTSSMSLENVSYRVQRDICMGSTHMTGALMTKTAFHSAQLRGKMENKV